jgi:hemoglobin
VSQSTPQPERVYDLVGGEPFFVALVERFYAGVERDPVLRPLYPDDLADSRRHLAGFLAQYFGGPPRYSEERGHPALRMRHMPFQIGETERDAWLTHMAAAVRASGLPPELEAAMLDYFTRAADWLVNRRPEGRRSLL